MKFSKLILTVLIVALFVPFFIACQDDSEDFDSDFSDEIDDDLSGIVFADDDDDVVDDDSSSNEDDDAADDDTFDDSEDISEEMPLLEAKIEALREKAHVPAVSVALVKDGELVWAKGFGLANVEKNIPATMDTLFQVASISKTVTGVAFMRAWQDSQFDLDADVNDALDFSVHNPRHEEDPITYRQLLTHTSSIRDNLLLLETMIEAGGQDFMPMEYFLSNYLQPDGLFYTRKSYWTWNPGKTWMYNNIDITLAAHLVEVYSGQAFDRYCREKIFRPLKMRRTSWKWYDFASSDVAMPYSYDSWRHKFVPYGHHAIPFYPSGSLVTSVRQLSRFLLMVMNDGEFDGTRIISKKTAREMKRPQVTEAKENQAIVFRYQKTDHGILFGHKGNYKGMASMMYYRPEDGVGFIVLTNGDWGSVRESRAIRDIGYLLLDSAPLFDRVSTE